MALDYRSSPEASLKAPKQKSRSQICAGGQRTMGRKRTKNLNLPMHMKARERASGTYYYYCIDGKEFPLGKDLVEAFQAVKLQPKPNRS
ncbi:MAG: hypothetical protein EB072_16930 [Betaproteobacteria bacterium]|nr:hypothetical protein [Betaproteobacteria bacterium]